ncbi:skin secretory protein xP2-like isoform X2 [Pyrgilauda ruficollis]|uniref:skin secretory protein xP2-like isoform X2 n=1 Tax=Pyrgilauda ruficollis TaxID=221976 RepID=UPI001B869CA7|nr:skin secretory protein xP2-like isoform X2 [Pyrgilauda ruficollis]
MDLPSPVQLPGGQGTAGTGGGSPPLPPPWCSASSHTQPHLPPAAGAATRTGTCRPARRASSGAGSTCPGLAPAPARQHPTSPPGPPAPDTLWRPPQNAPGDARQLGLPGARRGRAPLRHRGDTPRTARAAPAPAARRASSTRPLPPMGIPSPAPGREQAATAQLLRACRGPRGRTWREGGGKGQDADGTMRLPAQVAGGGRMRGCLRPRLWLPSAREGTMASHQRRGHRECGRGEAEPPAPLPASPRAPGPGYTQEAALVLSTTRRGNPLYPLTAPAGGQERHKARGHGVPPWDTRLAWRQ